MTHTAGRTIQSIMQAFLLLVLSGFANTGYAQAPIIHPGAPGEPARELKADEAIKIANAGFSPADSQFMQDMIPHHYQAVQMAALVATLPRPAGFFDPANPSNLPAKRLEANADVEEVEGEDEDSAGDEEVVGRIGLFRASGHLASLRSSKSNQ